MVASVSLAEAAACLISPLLLFLDIAMVALVAPMGRGLGSCVRSGRGGALRKGV